MKERRDFTSHKYMQELLSINYPGAEDLSNILYAWHANIRVMSTSNWGIYKSFSVYVKFNGGEFGEYPDLKLKFFDYRGNQTDELTIEHVANGDTIERNLDSYAGSASADDGRYRVECYDPDGNLIGSAEKNTN